MNAKIEELKSMMVQAVEFMFGSGSMQHSGHGNLSARLETDRMLLTRRGNIRGLTREAIATVTFEGEVLDGEIAPTTAEIVSMHAGVYRVKEQARSVIHNHAPNVTAFALAHVPLPCAYEALLRFGAPEKIPVADWAPRGAAESVTNIVELIRKNPDTPAVLLANHGLLAFGRDPLQTAQIVAALEEAAEATLKARTLGGEKPFPPGALEAVRERKQRF